MAAGLRRATWNICSMPTWFQYDELPGGQASSTTGRHALHRRRHRQAATWSIALAAVILVFLFLAFRRHPEWHDPVGTAFDAILHDSSSAVITMDSAHGGDTLPQIDWGWGDSGWFTKSPKMGSAAWLKRYPDFQHGPPPRQVGTGSP